MPDYYKSDTRSIGTEYTAVGKHQQDDDDKWWQSRATAHLIVTRPSMEPNFDRKGNVSKDYEGEDDPSTLFTHKPPTIIGAFTHSSMRHTVPTLFGLARNDHGNDLVVGESLSKHSSRLAKKGAKRGAVIANDINPDSVAMNDLTFNDNVNRTTDASLSKNDFLSDVPQEKVLQARKTVRDILRPVKPTRQHMGPQFYQPEAEQPQLPGMEGV